MKSGSWVCIGYWSYHFRFYKIIIAQWQVGVSHHLLASLLCPVIPPAEATA